MPRAVTHMAKCSRQNTYTFCQQRLSHFNPLLFPNDESIRTSASFDSGALVLDVLAGAHLATKTALGSSLGVHGRYSDNDRTSCRGHQVFGRSYGQPRRLARIEWQGVEQRSIYSASERGLLPQTVLRFACLLANVGQEVPSNLEVPDGYRQMGSHTRYGPRWLDHPESVPRGKCFTASESSFRLA